MNKPDPQEIMRRANQEVVPFLRSEFQARRRTCLFLAGLIFQSLVAIGWVLFDIGSSYTALTLGAGGVLFFATLFWKARCPRCEKFVWALPPKQSLLEWFGFPKSCPHCALSRVAPSESSDLLEP